MEAAGVGTNRLLASKEQCGGGTQERQENDQHDAAGAPCIEKQNDERERVEAPPRYQQGHASQWVMANHDAANTK